MRAIIASVVPEANFNLLRCAANIAAASRWWSATPASISASRSLVDRPEEVGADRLVNTVAAHDRYKRPLIVVDFGTATTFDVVDGDGNYRGGVIAPGINLSLQALHLAAAKLPQSRSSARARSSARSTVRPCSPVSSGAMSGWSRGWSAAFAERGAAMGVVATGGLAPLFAGATDAIDRVDPDLTLWGLRLIHRHNTNR